MKRSSVKISKIQIKLVTIVLNNKTSDNDKKIYIVNVKTNEVNSFKKKTKEIFKDRIPMIIMIVTQHDMIKKKRYYYCQHGKNCTK